MGFVTDRFENADRIILLARKRFYDTNVYQPLERYVKGLQNIKLWDKLNDKRKLESFYSKMKKAKIKNGNNDFSKDVVNDELFLNALEGFEGLLNNSVVDKSKVVDEMILPFIKKCENAELYGGI